jgi:hypothetical protein
MVCMSTRSCQSRGTSSFRCQASPHFVTHTHARTETHTPIYLTCCSSFVMMESSSLLNPYIASTAFPQCFSIGMFQYCAAPRCTAAAQWHEGGSRCVTGGFGIGKEPICSGIYPSARVWVLLVCAKCTMGRDLSFCDATIHFLSPFSCSMQVFGVGA